MTVYTYSKARQNFSTVLDRAGVEGEVYVKRKDGSLYVIRPFVENKSPLDVPGIKSDLNQKEIVDILREVRERQ